MASPEFLAVFRDELERGAADFADEARTIAHASDGDPALAAAIEVYGGQLARTKETAELIELAGLAAACELLGTNATALGELPQAARAQAIEHLAAWPRRFAEYLANPKEPGTVLRLVEFLAHPVLPAPLMPEYRDAIADSLAQIELTAAAEETALGPAPAAAPPPEPVGTADLVLVMPRDVDAAVRDAFLGEAPTHAEELARLVALICSGQASENDRRKAQRVAHSLKGSASIVGVRGIASLAHPLEDLLETMTGRNEAPDPRLARFLVDASACLAQMVSAVAGVDDPPAQPAKLVDTARQLAWHAQRRELEKGLDALPAAATDRPVAVAAPAVAAAAPAAPVENILRVPVRTVDELFRLLGELGTRGLRVQSEMQLAREHSRTLRESLESVIELLSGRVREEVTEALKTSRGLEERMHALLAEAQQQERVQRELGRIALSTRMLPVATLVPRLARNVRQTCRQLGKDAELRVTGEEILVDGDMLEALADPLLHILRNALDHGIEAPDVRREVGKPETGLVELIFARRGPLVTVTVRDDGKGLDYDRIRRKAIDRGLIPPDAMLPRSELANLTLLAGFSTKDKVSEVSGRGVGMDVVAERLQAMKGSVTIYSEPGQGCEIVLQFQATLVSQHALLVETGGATFAVPSHQVEIALAPEMGRFLVQDGRVALNYQGQVYPLYTLGRLTGLEVEPIREERVRSSPALVITVNEKSTAVVVDRLLDGREFIVKNAGRFLRRLHGLAGAVVLPSGAIAPLVDVAEMVRAEQSRERAALFGAGGAAARVG